MPDPIYVDSIKVSAGPFTVRTRKGQPVLTIQRKGTLSLVFSLAELELLHQAIGEYLHMRGMEDA